MAVSLLTRAVGRVVVRERCSAIATHKLEEAGLWRWQDPVADLVEIVGF
jgi:hypothetical protein